MEQNCRNYIEIKSKILILQQMKWLGEIILIQETPFT